MENLLFLVHRIPYPPNKGDKIRSYNLLKYLLKHYNVYLAAFIDNEDDWKHVEQLKEWCTEAHFIDLNPTKAKIKSLQGLLSDQPLTLPYYKNRELQTWVDQTLQKNSIKRTITFSSAMAQYLTAAQHQQVCRVIDFVDIDSDKWQQYAEHKPWPLSWVYRREAKQLLKYEREIAAQFDASLFVSRVEAELFKTLAPESAQKVDFFNNGVDSEFFAPDKNASSPYNDGDQVIVFSGAMDYWPNIDAVNWFTKEILPKIQESRPKVKFYIVGSKPSEAVTELAKTAGVTVTGFVDDMRPYLQYATFAVVPMRVARGIQNKVLEAMAMEKTVLVTSPGLEGIDATPEEELILADDPETLIKQSLHLLAQDNAVMGKKARQLVCNNFNWDENLPKVGELLEQGCTE